jgi:CHAD domain-containing protein
MAAIAFHLRPGEDPAEGLSRLGCFLVHQITRACAPPVRRSDASVHLARVSLKRLRALVRLAAPSAKDSETRRVDSALRSAGRKLAAARDAAVARSLGRSVRKADPGRALAGVAKSLDHMEPALARVLGGADAATLERGWRRGARSARHLALHLAHRTPTRRYHQLRTKAKCLAYQVTLIEPALDSEGRRWLRRLAALHRQLGRANDLALFGSKSERATVARLHERARHDARRLFETRPRDLASGWARAWELWDRGEGR